MQIAPLSVALALALAPAQDPTPDAAARASAPAGDRDYVGPAAIDAPVAPAIVAAPAEPPVEATAPGAEEGSDASYGEGDDPLFDDEDDAFIAEDYDPLRDSPEALKAKGWVRSGIVFTVVGGVLAIGGTIMAFTDPCDLSAGNGCQELARDRAAQSMAIPGAAMLAGGIAMLVVGKRQEKKLRASVQALRRGGGLSLSLSF